MKITAAEKTKDGQMIRIFLDGRYAFSIPQEAYVTGFLYEREEIFPAEVESIKNTVLVQNAREKAVRLLTSKDRTEHELVERLRAEGFDQDVARMAVDGLKSIGYVDDSRFILKYASDRMKNRALSKKALSYELAQKGIETALITEVLADFEQNDEEVALRAARKKFGKYDIKAGEMEKKVMGFLAHRGFSIETAKSVLKRLENKD